MSFLPVFPDLYVTSPGYRFRLQTFLSYVLFDVFENAMLNHDGILALGATGNPPVSRKRLRLSCVSDNNKQRIDQDIFQKENLCRNYTKLSRCT
jgi:hypothetical protein